MTADHQKHPDQGALPLGLADGEVAEVSSFTFAPIKGYPLLSWKGKEPFRSTRYFPAQLREVYGEERDGWRNKLYWGDNLQVMSHLLKQFRGSVDLVYIDPPFDSKADYKKTIKVRGKSAETDLHSFEEKQYSDIWSNDSFLQFMYERLILVRELLSPSGNIILHCDPSRGHHLRCIMDEVFGEANFVNEIIWSYRRWPSNSRAFQAMHDNLLFYNKHRASSERVFNKEYEEASESYMKRFGGKTQILDSDSGTRKITSEEETKGMPRRDVWDISILAGMSPERTGYPTQKPEALLERIISACSDPGQLVFDCFMGSGTTQAVAMKLGRRFIGADINLGAIHTATKRLLNVAEQLQAAPTILAPNIFTGIESYNVNHYDIFRNPTQAKDLLIEALEVEPLTGSLFDGQKDGRMIKIMPVNRIATRADLNELIAGFDYKVWERRQSDHPSQPVERITLVCMGHEPDLKSQLVYEAKPFRIDVEVVDVLRDKTDLEFRRDAEAKIAVAGAELLIERFYPMNLLQKLSRQRESVEDWRELVDSILIDWNYDGAVLQPAVIDIPGKGELVTGRYPVPGDAGTIRVKITDLLSESWEGNVEHG